VIISGKVFDTLDGDDFIRISEPHTEVRCCIMRDPCPSNKPHEDFIQPIPKEASIQRSQYAAALLDGLIISGVYMESTGLRQGVFAGDGLFRNLFIQGCVISTNSQHEISINGLLDGWIGDNLRPDGSPCIVRLGSLRIGGKPKGGVNLRVLSFASNDYCYAPADEIVDGNALPCLVDTRSIPVSPNDEYLRNFDVDGFKEATVLMPAPRNVDEHCRQLQALAKQFGDLVRIA
jgi:hypothetical protein